MNKRTIYISLCIFSLCLGGIIYITLKPSSYISIFIQEIIPLSTNLIYEYETTSLNFIKYYFPDFLWSFSLYCALSIISNTNKMLLINGFIVFVIGVSWEFCQKAGIVPGTGDCIDIIMYLLSVLIILIPSIVTNKKSRC